MQNARSASAKSNHLKIIAGAKAPKLPQGDRPIRAGGVAPPANMPAGKYIGLIEGARVATNYGKPTAVIVVRVTEGKFAGVSLSGYFPIDLNGEVTTAGCLYNKMCEIVLDRELEPGDDIHPARVFPGKLVEVVARFSKTTGSGKSRVTKDSSIKADLSDKLRIGEILRLVEPL
jgi:hypothetical protein